jgi:hypothetical protein
MGVVAEVVSLEGLLQASLELLPVAPDQFGASYAVRWIFRVQVERQPLDRGAEPAREPLGRPLADAAEGSDVVRPDQDLVHGKGR